MGYALLKTTRAGNSPSSRAKNQGNCNTTIPKDGATDMISTRGRYALRLMIDITTKEAGARWSPIRQQPASRISSSNTSNRALVSGRSQSVRGVGMRVYPCWRVQ